MDKRELERALKHNGFEEVRKVKHGTRWRLGEHVMQVSGTPSDNYAMNNAEADMNRIIRLVRPDGTIERRVEKKREVEPVVEVKNRHASKAAKFDHETRLQIHKQIAELIKMNKSTHEIAQILLVQGIKTPNGGPLNSTFVLNQMGTMRRYGTLPKKYQTAAPVVIEAMPAPVIAPTPAPIAPPPKPELITKISNRIPDTCMAILTDPSLSDTRKVRMVLAYAEE